MAKMKIINLKRLVPCLTCFMIGVILGSASLVFVVSYRVDSYYKKVKYLENTIKDRDIRLEKLQDSFDKSKFILSDIEVIMKFDGYELDKITIENIIKSKYSTLLGKEVDSIDTDIILQVIDDTVIRLNRKEYIVNIEKLVLSKELKLWVKIEDLE